MAAFDGLAVAVRETRHEPATRVQGSSRVAMDWDDVRVFLAVAREGSMRAAGRALGLSQPTIARRLAAFDASFGGATLFDRLPEGLRLNDAGEQLVPAAESVEDAVLTLERPRAGSSGRSKRRASRWRCAPHRCSCIWKRSAPVPAAAYCMLCRRPPSPARAADPADPRNRGRILDHRPP